MQPKNETFQRFGKSFQEDLCHLILQDRPFCDQITEVLDLDFLQYADGSNNLKQISNLINTNYKETKKIYLILKKKKLIK